MKKRKKIPNRGHVEQDKMARSIDALSQYEEFVEQVPKRLRDALLRGATAKEIYEEFSQDAAARAVLIAMTEKDAGKALAAIKSIEDRVHGKPTEKRETTHIFDDLPDEELDAILKSELEDVEGALAKPDKRKH